MCDSFVALPSATDKGKMIMAKSADCQVNEALALVNIPGHKHVHGEAVRTTHLVIPQADETYDVILGKSFWTWGAELGINEHGVAIGNEAVFSTLQATEAEDGVMTIDMVRIGLERGRTAQEAIEAMTAVLEQFGQGGNCELSGNSHFDGSYLIADPEEAWILETGGRQWAAKRVKKPIASISNFYGIGTNWDCSSLDPGEDWAGTYADLAKVPETGSRERQALSHQCLVEARDQISVRTAFDILREHGPDYDPATAELQTNICVHAGPNEHRQWQATGAMVAELGSDGTIGWFTGTSANCLSIFKPIFPDVEIPEVGPKPNETFDPNTLWWRHELLHRRAMADFHNVMPEIRAEIESLEAEFLHEADNVLHGTVDEKKSFVEHCFGEANKLTEEWIERLASRDNLVFDDPEYAEMWQKFNSRAGLTGIPAS